MDRRMHLVAIVACVPMCSAFATGTALRSRSPQLTHHRNGASASSSRRQRINGGIVAAVVDTGTFAALDEWFRTAPYQSAFCVTAFKATLADLITQTRERLVVEEAIKAGEDERFSSDGDSKYLLIDGVVSCDEVSGDEVQVARTTTIVESDEISIVSSNEITFPSKLARVSDDGISCVEVEPELPPLSLPRLATFFLYGGLYQGCVQYFIFNELYPVWFGEGTDVATIAIKVCVDQFVLTPFLCLPVCYLVKALVFSYPLREGLERYIADARRDLLVKYWVLWGPVQCLTFSVVPPQWRVPFIALMSFFWLLILSTITARQESEPRLDARAAAQNAASS